MGLFYDFIPVTGSFSVGTIYDKSLGTLEMVTDDIVDDDPGTWVYNGSALTIDGISSSIDSSRYVNLDYYDDPGNLLATAGQACHITLVDGRSFLVLSDNNANKDLQGIESIEVTYVDTLSTIAIADTSLDADDALAVVCFAAGTRITTPAGPRNVADIRPGDVVVTLDHGPQPVRVVTHRTLTFSRPPDKRKPILIRAGALGPGAPGRDLKVSPQHRMLVTDPATKREYLLAACKLLNRSGIRRMNACRQVGYVHLLFDRHEIVFAENAATESLLYAPYPAALLRAARSVRTVPLAARTMQPARPVLRKDPVSAPTRALPPVTNRTPAKTFPTGHRPSHMVHSGNPGSRSVQHR